MELIKKQFRNIDLSDPFFDSLKTDYNEFPQWFAKKSGEYAYVFEGEGGTIDGFLYLKVEDGPLTDIDPPLTAAHRLKVGTMKINAHGTKLGERFIKKIFDHAVFEGIEEIYVTVFEDHAPLIALFERYGFEQRARKTTKNGTELVLVRTLHSPYKDEVISYPLIQLKDKQSYLLSLYPKWHTRLLPDSILETEGTDIVQDISHTNSIHKVYLASMKGMENLTKGDVLLIYRTTDGKGPAHYRSVVTSICVLEEYRPINSFTSLDVFLRYCRPYSVFSDAELRSFWSTRRYPHVIRFTYNIALKKRITRGVMIDKLGFDREAYWGFMPITQKQLLSIVYEGGIDESLIIH